LKTESRIERKKEETHNRIITVAIELFNRFGLESVTMEKIAETVDIAKGTLYNYYPSKEAIINAYLQRSFREKNEDRVAQFHQLPDTRSRLTYLLEQLLEGVQRQKDVFEVYMVYRMKQVISFRADESEQSGLSNLAREIIVLGQASHELRSDQSIDMLEDFFEFVMIEAVKPFYLDPDHFDPQASVERSVDLFLNGAGA
jgi:AcrR family transcriptional regulator